MEADPCDWGDPPFPVMYFFDGHHLFRGEEAACGKSWGLDVYCAVWNIIVNCEGDKACRNYGIGSPPLIGMKRSPLEMDGWGQCSSAEQ